MTSKQRSGIRELLAKLWPGSRAQRSQGAEQPVPIPDGYEPLSIQVAGIMHENRAQTVKQCALREPVRLVRDRDNLHDPNAIRILNRNDEMLGFVGRHLTSLLAAFLDASDSPVQAWITELWSEVSGSEIVAKVGLYVPVTVASELRADTAQLGYYLDTGSSGSIYLLLDCEEAQRNEITSRLDDGGYSWTRFGVSHRPASDGHQYQWYILLDDSVTQDAIERFLHENPDVFPQATPPDPALEEWIESFDAEKTDLNEQNALLKSKVAGLEGQLERKNEGDARNKQRIKQLERNLAQSKAEVQPLIQTLLPNVQFIRDSLDVVTTEYASYQQVLQDVAAFVRDPQSARGVRVESATGWREIHCSTGQKNDGRVYLKHDHGEWLVLISFKHAQKEDMEYLKRY